jgi:hypothetical protein
MFFVILLVNISTINAQPHDPYYIDTIDKNYFGIYLPLEYIMAIELTKNHSFSLGLNKERSYHDILIVMENIVYSDYRFCDQYAILSKEFSKYNFSVNTNNETFIRDNNGELYKKISDDTENYRSRISYYIGRIILHDLNKKRIGLRFSGSEVIIPFLNNQIYEIIIHEKGLYLGYNLVLFNKKKNEWIYLEIRDKRKYTFYEGEISGLQIIKTNRIKYEIIL